MDGTSARASPCPGTTTVGAGLTVQSHQRLPTAATRLCLVALLLPHSIRGLLLQLLALLHLPLVLPLIHLYCLVSQLAVGHLYYPLLGLDNREQGANGDQFATIVSCRHLDARLNLSAQHPPQQEMGCCLSATQAKGQCYAAHDQRQESNPQSTDDSGSNLQDVQCGDDSKGNDGKACHVGEQVRIAHSHRPQDAPDNSGHDLPSERDHQQY